MTSLLDPFLSAGYVTVLARLLGFPHALKTDAVSKPCKKQWLPVTLLYASVPRCKTPTTFKTECLVLGAW